MDALLVPTAPSIYTIAQLREDPLALNSRLGRYTNFANLADLCALALPAGMRGDGLPAGITVLGLAWQDHALAFRQGKRWQARLACRWAPPASRCPPRRRRVIRRRACCAWPWWARTSAACR